MLEGYSYQWVDHLKAAAPTWGIIDDRKGWGYVYENISRVFYSAVSLLEFDLTSLSKGYLDTGAVSDVDLTKLSSLLLVTQRGAEPAVFVYTQKKPKELEIVARLVARRQTLGEVAVQPEKDGIAVFAVGGSYLYRWNLFAPTPVFEFNIAERGIPDVTDTIDLLHVERKIDGAVFISTIADKVFHLSGGELQSITHSKGHVAWTDDVITGFYTAAIEIRGIPLGHFK